jgi:hypothetical protein
MSNLAARRFAVSFVAAAALVATLAGPAQAQDDPNPGALTISGAVDFTNAYMFRGIRQETEKLIVWPYFDLGIAAYSNDKGGLRSVGVNFGTWNSLHKGLSGSDGPSGKLWYESDFYATVGFGFGGGVSAGATWTSYTSPNNMFSTVKEIAFKVSVDDSSHLGKAAVHPWALLGFEVDVNGIGQGQADGGGNAGKYLELGVAPGYSASRASLSVPIKVGLSAGNYYEVCTARCSTSTPVYNDDTFGYFSAAGVVTVPFSSKPTKFGTWNVHGGVEFQKYGGTLKLINEGLGLDNDHKVIVSGGIGFTY